jgi:hypothetical protein
MDKAKDDDSAAGDYIVWEQVLLEASARKVDVLFVTGDVKEDWWREEAGERRGPRLELAQELRDRADVRLFMLRPSSLLEHARKHLGLEVAPESVQEVERVDQFLSQTQDSSTGGWSVAAISALLKQLHSEAPVQAAAIRQAARQGGFVSRDQVYELGGYSEERSLRGFTRPVNRIIQEFRSIGIVDDGAVDVLVTRYEGGVLATGFVVHDSLIPLLSPCATELHVLRFISREFDASPDRRGLEVDEIERGTSVARPVLVAALRDLHEGGYIRGIMAAELNYLVQVIGLTERGRAKLDSAE